MLWGMKSATIEPKAAQFQKVAECLYRHTSSTAYYGLVKRAGKQYRRSLKTVDRNLAERILADFRQKVGRLGHVKGWRDVTFADVGKQWLFALSPQLKPSSAARRETSLAQLGQYPGSGARSQYQRAYVRGVGGQARNRRGRVDLQP